MHISLENVGFSHSADFALKDISLEIRAGESIAIMGINGSGKTTLMNLIAGLIKPEEGKILSDGVDIHSGKKSIRAYWNKVGYLVQSSERMVFASNVYKEIEYPLRARGFSRKDAASFVSKAMDISGVCKDHGERHPVTLSGGELRKVMMAVSISYEPELLLLDEPLIGLDFDSRKGFYHALESFKDKSTILMITHDALSALRMDRLLIIDGGRIIYDGTPYIVLDKDKYSKYGIINNEILDINELLKEKAVEYKDALKEVLDEF